MKQDFDQAEKKTTRLRQEMSSLDFIFLSDFEKGTDTLEGTAEPADEGTSTLEPPSAFIEMNRNLLESSSPSNSKKPKRNC